MGAAALLSTLRAAGAQVHLTSGKRVRVEAPEGLINDQLRRELQLERDNLVTLLVHDASRGEQIIEPLSFASVVSAQPTNLTDAWSERTQQTQDHVHVSAEIQRADLSALAPIPCGLPIDWQNGLAHLSSMQPLAGVKRRRWALGVWWARRIAYEHRPSAYVLGWHAEDLFGLDPNAPAARYDSMGLSFLLHAGDSIESIDDEWAILAGRKSRHRMRRGHHPCTSKAAWLLG